MNPEKNMARELIKSLKDQYGNIERIEIEDDGVLSVYAPDDTLWKIFDDNMGNLNLEFEAGAREQHYLRIVIWLYLIRSITFD